MSNIGKQRILIPKNVNLKCDGWKLSASGKYGTVIITLPHHTQLLIEDNYLRLVAPHIDPALYGSLQRKLKALIHGLSLEYVSILEFVGVGYKPRIEKNMLILRLGFSHEISLAIPEDLEVSHLKRNNLKITGSNFERVRQFAYKLRSFRRPEPFKGKGIVILGEVVRRKEGKKKKI
jgi:large subunit ribosomal protein L6